MVQNTENYRKDQSVRLQKESASQGFHSTTEVVVARPVLEVLSKPARTEVIGHEDPFATREAPQVDEAAQVVGALGLTETVEAPATVTQDPNAVLRAFFQPEMIQTQIYSEPSTPEAEQYEADDVDVLKPLSWYEKNDFVRVDQRGTGNFMASGRVVESGYSVTSQRARVIVRLHSGLEVFITDAKFIKFDEPAMLPRRKRALEALLIRLEPPTPPQKKEVDYRNDLRRLDSVSPFPLSDRLEATFKSMDEFKVGDDVMIRGNSKSGVWKYAEVVAQWGHQDDNLVPEISLGIYDRVRVKLGTTGKYTYCDVGTVENIRLITERENPKTRVFSTDEISASVAAENTGSTQNKSTSRPPTAAFAFDENPAGQNPVVADQDTVAPQQIQPRFDRPTQPNDAQIQNPGETAFWSKANTQTRTLWFNQHLAGAASPKASASTANKESERTLPHSQSSKNGLWSEPQTQSLIPTLLSIMAEKANSGDLHPVNSTEDKKEYQPLATALYKRATQPIDVLIDLDAGHGWWNEVMSDHRTAHAIQDAQENQPSLIKKFWQKVKSFRRKSAPSDAETTQAA